MNKLCTLAGLVAALALPTAAHADAINAVQARALVADGAQAWDVRPAATPLLPGAARADLAAWRLQGSAAALVQAAAAAGIDLSRDVVVYGAAGDRDAQALQAALAALNVGRVHWLVGGIDEWRAAGLPTAAEASTRLPVPQHWAAGGAGSARAAAASRREPAAPVHVVAAR